MSTFYEANGVQAWELSFNDESPSFLGVSDTRIEMYRIRLFPHADGTVGIDVCAKPYDGSGRLGGLTNDIPRMSYIDNNDELDISDDGLLRVMVRAPAAAYVDFRVGFSLRLPVEYVEPIRMVIESAKKMAAERNAAAISTQRSISTKGAL